MRICLVCPYCAASLEQRDEPIGMRCCWRCLRPILIVEAAREPNAAELAAIGHEELGMMRRHALDFRESIRE